MFKVAAHRNLTFQIKGAEKTAGGLYTPTKGYMDYLDCAPVWIAQIGSESMYKDEIKPGDVALVLDHMELEEIPDLWDHYKDDPRFKLLADRVKEVDGYVSTSVMHDSAFIALVDICEPSESSDTIRFGSGSTGLFGIRE